MALPKNKFRELVFQLLYSQDFLRIKGEDYLPFMMAFFKTGKKNVKLAYERGLEVLKKLEKIDSMIVKASPDYRIERISKVELNVLRLGLFELFSKDVPEKVAISEAVRLCRKFGTRQGAKFVNAILDNLYKNAK